MKEDRNTATARTTGAYFVCTACNRQIKGDGPVWFAHHTYCQPQGEPTHPPASGQYHRSNYCCTAECQKQVERTYYEIAPITAEDFWMASGAYAEEMEQRMVARERFTARQADPEEERWALYAMQDFAIEIGKSNRYMEEGCHREILPDEEEETAEV